MNDQITRSFLHKHLMYKDRKREIGYRGGEVSCCDVHNTITITKNHNVFRIDVGFDPTPDEINNAMFLMDAWISGCDMTMSTKLAMHVEIKKLRHELDEFKRNSSYA